MTTNPTIPTMRTDLREIVWHAASRRFGRLMCATSDHADGSPRVLIEFNDGTESAIREAELTWPNADMQAGIAELSNTASLLRELVDWAREHTSPRDPNSPHDILVRAVAHLTTINA